MAANRTSGGHRFEERGSGPPQRQLEWREAPGSSTAPLGALECRAEPYPEMLAARADTRLEPSSLGANLPGQCCGGATCCYSSRW